MIPTAASPATEATTRTEGRRGAIGMISDAVCRKVELLGEAGSTGTESNASSDGRTWVPPGTNPPGVGVGPASLLKAAGGAALSAGSSVARRRGS